MSALSIFAEDSDPGERPALELHRAARDESGLPPVLLRLPELEQPATEVTNPKIESARRASRVYWALVFVGGLVAIGLNLPSGKQAEPPLEPAPVWTAPEQTPAATSVPATVNHGQSANQAPAWPPAAPAQSHVEVEATGQPSRDAAPPTAAQPRYGQPANNEPVYTEPINVPLSTRNEPTATAPVAPPIVPGDASGNPTATLPMVVPQ